MTDKELHEAGETLDTMVYINTNDYLDDIDPNIRDLYLPVDRAKAMVEELKNLACRIESAIYQTERRLHTPK